jgi:hypothetical protein
MFPIPILLHSIQCTLMQLTLKTTQNLTIGAAFNTFHWLLVQLTMFPRYCILVFQLADCSSCQDMHSFCPNHFSFPVVLIDPVVPGQIRYATHIINVVKTVCDLVNYSLAHCCSKRKRKYVVHKKTAEFINTLNLIQHHGPRPVTHIFYLSGPLLSH